MNGNSYQYGPPHPEQYEPVRPSAHMDGNLPPSAGYVRDFHKGMQMDENMFMLAINQWLADYPQIGNARCNFNSSLRLGLLVNHEALQSVTLSYDIMPMPTIHQYAIVILNNFGLLLAKPEKLIYEWTAVNPWIEVLGHQSSTHSRGPASMFGPGIGGANRTQVFMFIRFLRK